MERVTREYICDSCKKIMGIKADSTFRGGNGEMEFELHFCTHCLELLLDSFPEKDEDEVYSSEEITKTVEDYCEGILCEDCLIEGFCRHNDFWNNPILQLEAYERIKEDEGRI